MDQVSAAEDDVLRALGELGRWLEGGYGLHESAIWDDHRGIRKMRQSPGGKSGKSSGGDGGTWSDSSQV